MSDKQPIRLGVVGLGNFGLLHAQTILRLAECRLVVLVDHHRDRLQQSDGWPGVASYDDLAVAMDHVSVDGWVIATSSASHTSIARQILSAGGRVLVEKPLAESLHDAKSIADLVRPDSSNLMLGHLVLFGSEFRALVHETKTRSPIQFIDAVRHRPQTTLDRFPGESPFHLTMVHDLYCVQVLMQRAEPKHISSQIHHHTDGSINLALMQLQWDDGSIASLTASFLTPPGMPADGFDRMEVFGRDWAARLNPNPRPIELWDEAARRPLTLEMGCDRTTGLLAEELRHFSRVIRGESSVPIGATYPDALQIQRWLEAAIEAHHMS